MTGATPPFAGIGASVPNATKAFRAFAHAGASMRPIEPFFRVERHRDDYQVSWRVNAKRNLKIYHWFKERGYQGRFIDQQRSKGRYVNCDRDMALLSKLTWGGEV